MKIRTMLILAALLSSLAPNLSHADDLFRLYWRGTYYTKNSNGRIVAVPFTEQDFVNQIAQNNGLDPSGCVMVYRPDKRDTAVVLAANGKFVADFIQMEYQYTDVNNPWNTVTVRQALLFNEAHQNAIGSWAGLELRSFSNGALANDVLQGWFQYSIPESDAVYMGNAVTGARVNDTSGG